MTVEIRPITVGEVTEFRRCLAQVFGLEVDTADDADSRFLRKFDVARSYAAFDGARLAATSGAFSMDMTLPGGATSPFGGLTMVSVRPEYRRRGLLRRMMDAHFADVAERGEMFSALWASEAPIYGRFGYGVATWLSTLSLDVLRCSFRPPGSLDAVTRIETEQATGELPPIYERVRTTRPGMLSRTEPWWRDRHFREGNRGPLDTSSAPRQFAIARRGELAVGYAAFRQCLAFDQCRRPDGKIEVVELVAADGRAEASLWNYLVHFDLYPTLTCWNLPTDSILPWLLGDARSAKLQTLDAMWLRITDIPAALSARGYRVRDALTLAVRDADEVHNVTLECDGTAAECRVSTRSPELELSVDDLASLYFGGARATTLARAGRIRGGTSELERADRVFASPEGAGWCPEIF